MNLHVTNPEFMERFEYFAYEEAVQEKGQELPFLRVVNEILEEREFLFLFPDSPPQPWKNAWKKGWRHRQKFLEA